MDVREEQEKEQGLPPEKVVQIMAKHGEVITLEEATTMLKAVSFFVKIAINEYLRER